MEFIIYVLAAILLTSGIKRLAETVNFVFHKEHLGEVLPAESQYPTSSWTDFPLLALSSPHKICPASGTTELNN